MNSVQLLCKKKKEHVNFYDVRWWILFWIPCAIAYSIIARTYLLVLELSQCYFDLFVLKISAWGRFRSCFSGQQLISLDSLQTRVINHQIEFECVTLHFPQNIFAQCKKKTKNIALHLKLDQITRSISMIHAHMCMYSV